MNIEIIRRIGLALLVGVAVVLCSAIVLTLLYLNDAINYRAVSALGVGALFVTGVIGALVSVGRGGFGIAVLIAIYECVLTLLLIAVGGLIFEGSLTHVIRTIVVLAVSGVISCAIYLRNRKSNRKRKLLFL